MEPSAPEINIRDPLLNTEPSAPVLTRPRQTPSESRLSLDLGSLLSPRNLIDSARIPVAVASELPAAHLTYRLAHLSGRPATQHKIRTYPARFTFCVTFAQVFILGTMMVVYGIAPWGMGVAYQEHENVPIFADVTLSQRSPINRNMWYGPPTYALVWFGAKYTPCMRQEPLFTNASHQTIQRETDFGCCKSSGGECGLTDQATCEFTFNSKWHDVQTCSEVETCQTVTLRPCCYSIGNQCLVTSREHCASLSAPSKWHEDLERCSEVPCEEMVCGMGWLGRFGISNLQTGDAPNQFWRFVAPLGVHVGVGHLIANLIFQIPFCAGLERVCGSFRVMAMYFVSGFCGNVMAGVFSPLTVSCGASSALYGMLGVAVIDLVYSWRMIPNKWREAITLGVQCFVVLAAGTLPWLDNFAHVGGFLAGLVSGVAFLPSLSPTPSGTHMMIVWAGRMVVLGIIAGSLVLFYTTHNPNFCSWCKYISCVPYVHGLCDGYS
eukprot:c11422_g1_i2.p1 GENE.c11422_g1_i2~~c11422_g1_i2.p1  ORF type:complete len:493 (+),score=86.29 c11422_g1_i2:71-1549(+)